MTDQELLATAGDFAIATLLGALIGIEREKRKSEDDDTGHVAGLGTFTFLALLGAVAGWLSSSAAAQRFFIFAADRQKASLPKGISKSRIRSA